jgi:hypothetical protein
MSYISIIVPNSQKQSASAQRLGAAEIMDTLSAKDMDMETGGEEQASSNAHNGSRRLIRIEAGE